VNKFDLFHHITEKEALEMGMTHHASYFLIPIWIGEDGDDIIFCTKWCLMEFAFTFIHFFESIFLLMLFQEVTAHVSVGEEIDIWG